MRRTSRLQIIVVAVLIVAAPGAAFLFEGEYMETIMDNQQNRATVPRTEEKKPNKLELN